VAQDQQLEVFGPGRATPAQEQAKDLSETDNGETEDHRVIVAANERNAGEEEVPGREATLGWYPSRPQNVAEGSEQTRRSCRHSPLGRCRNSATAVPKWNLWFRFYYFQQKAESPIP